MLDELRWKKFHVGSDGFVCLVDAMGDDASICQAASVSYGLDKRDNESETKPELIRYLMRNKHTTPFEMCEVKLLVRVPMDCWRQWIRHRTANVNEYSTRYKPAINSFATTEPECWRLQSKDNKQGSSGLLPADSLEQADGNWLTRQEQGLHRLSVSIYNERLKAGIAKEQARKDLPLSTYTEAYWKCDLHNILNFLRLRMDSHAQLEIREYANVIGNEIIKPLFPITWQAFEDYTLNAMTLSDLDIKAAVFRTLDHFTNERERRECQEKLKNLGIRLTP